MNTDRISELRKEWEAEEQVAHIHGWDFSHIHGRYEEEDDLPWDYKEIIDEFLLPDMKLLDFDTGGGEFLLSLKHPYKNTAATEGYAPNVELCKEILLPLGIDFRPCDDESNIPFADSFFDIMINRQKKFLNQSGSTMLVHLYGSHTLSNGNSQDSLLINALRSFLKCRKQLIGTDL